MFNLFNKKEEENPISDMFIDLSTNQKMSVINLLLTIGVCDDGQGDEDKELQYLNTFCRTIDIRGDKSNAYLESFGHERIVDDLKTMTEKQKEFLVLLAWDMIICDGRPNETELQLTNAIFEKIGISDKQFVATIEKAQALTKLYFGK
jgi:uncharacterized tellurite resistance protein B-like protein